MFSGGLFHAVAICFLSTICIVYHTEYKKEQVILAEEYKTRNEEKIIVRTG